MKKRKLVFISIFIIVVSIFLIAYEAKKEKNSSLRNSIAGEDSASEEKEEVGEDGSVILEEVMMGEESSQKNEDQYLSENRFWFPMKEDRIEIDVQCDISVPGWYEGNATLAVERLPETGWGNLYELYLMNFSGTWECWEHGIEESSECENLERLGVGYFLVLDDDDNEIYNFPYGDETLEKLKDLEPFPPDLDDKEKIPYIIWRLVCSEKGFDDTYNNDFDDLEKNTAQIEGRYLGDERYHNFISTKEGERRYNLYPSEEYLLENTEHTHMTWGEDTGLVKYISYVGSFARGISFWQDGYEEYSKWWDMKKSEL